MTALLAWVRPRKLELWGYIKWNQMPGNTLALRTMNLNLICIKIYLRASNSPPIGLKTIGYCQNSHMRIIVNQAPLFLNGSYFLWNDVRNLSPLSFSGGGEEGRSFRGSRGSEFNGVPSFQDTRVSEAKMLYLTFSLLWHLQRLIYQYNFNFPGLFINHDPQWPVRAFP